MNRAIVFTFNCEDAMKALELTKEINDIYNKKLKYTFSIDIYTKHQKSDDEENIALVAVLNLLDGVQRDKKMSAKSQIGLGYLKKKALCVQIMQLDDISEVEWTKDEKENEKIT